MDGAVRIHGLESTKQLPPRRHDGAESFKPRVTRWKIPSGRINRTSVVSACAGVSRSVALVDLHGAPPLSVKPAENSQGTDLDRARRHDLHPPQIGISDRRDIYRPNRAPSGNQAAQALFCPNAHQTAALAFGFLGSLGNLNYWHEPVLGIEVAFAPRVPIDEVAIV